MTARFSNQFQSYLTEPLNIDATVIKIPPEDVKRLPILNDTDWCPLNINDPRGYEEIVHVTKVNADGSLTVKRAQEGTEAKNFRVESRVDIRLTAQSIESFLGLYYGARTVPPSNAQTGAAYLDISQKPNALKVLGDNGWANAVSYSLAGLRQQLFVPTEATKGPFTVPGGFTSGFANVNGLSVYAGHGMTIDAANASFKLDAEVPAGTIIVFQGYLANDAVDVFTKAEINERLSNLSTGDLKETDDRKFMTAAERKSITDVNNRLDGLTTDNVPETPTHKYFPPDFNADNLPETDTRKFMTAAERAKIAAIEKNYLPIGERDKISKQIDVRFNACVTDTRVFGYGEFAFTPGEGGKSAFDNPVPSGYVMTGLWKINSQWEVISYSQPQVYIANRGWFALGGW
ncbi:unnamed protein product [Bartonella choladocola]|uniref:hypothetical protein n=1 Tax=Bartonella choladocola TaxID=2750995 RepID=UPI003997685B